MKKIILFLRNLFKSSENEKLREKILSERIDFSNVISSSLLAKGLYDELKKVCHPDRFHNENDINKANELFQSVTQHKGDYNELLSLKERIYRELPLNK